MENQLTRRGVLGGIATGGLATAGLLAANADAEVKEQVIDRDTKVIKWSDPVFKDITDDNGVILRLAHIFVAKTTGVDQSMILRIDDVPKPEIYSIQATFVGHDPDLVAKGRFADMTIGVAMSPIERPNIIRVIADFKKHNSQNHEVYFDLAFWYKM